MINKLNSEKEIHLNEILLEENIVKPYVILFSGKFGSGKTYYSQKLKSKLEYIFQDEINVEILSFAFKVKEIALNQFKWNGIKDEKGRRLLQLIGTEVGRGYNENIWVDYINREIEGIYNINFFYKKLIFILDDFRFINEYNNLHLMYKNSILTEKYGINEFDLFKAFNSKFSFKIESNNNFNYDSSEINLHESEKYVDSLPYHKSFFNDVNNRDNVDSHIDEIIKIIQI